MARPVTQQVPPTTAVDSETSTRVPIWVLAIYCVGGAAYVMLFAGAITSYDSELLHALTIAPILFGLTIPIALRIARTEHDRWFAHVIMAGFVVKFLGALVRYHIAYNFYGPGRTDSYQYHLAGQSFAPSFRRLVFTTEYGSLIGTSFIKVFTGGVYAVFGISIPGGFFVFGWLSFLGLLLFARAFRLGVPGGDQRRYMIAVLFLPGLVYWPSSIGKEGFMMLALGLSAYGIAGVFQRRTSAVFALAAGIGGALLVRPHLALIVFVGLVFALLVRRAPAHSYAAPLVRIGGLVALLVLGLFVTSQTASFLGQPELTADTVSQQLAATSEQTSDGGSEFTPIDVNNPVAMFPAFITVFFRPFPIEVSSAQELASATEGLLLLGLLVAARKRIRSIPRLIRTQPYVAFCIGYVLAFVFAFSSFANFGILARQRVQAIPFLLVALALPKFTDLVAEESPAAPTATTAVVAAVAPAPTATGRRRRRPTRRPVSSGASFAPPPRPAVEATSSSHDSGLTTT
ncbi:MAG: hypothetical protein ACKOA9_13280 [Actinomycetota bacterium]